MAVKRKKSAKKKAEKQVIAKKKTRNPASFEKGNTAGSKTKGKHRSHSKKLDFAEAFKAAITYQDIKAIAKAMVVEAKDGNVKAASMILDRCCGKPAQAIALTGADGEALAPITIILQHGEVQK